jgi:hypothetical protein
MTHHPFRLLLAASHPEKLCTFSVDKVVRNRIAGFSSGFRKSHWDNLNNFYAKQYIYNKQHVVLILSALLRSSIGKIVCKTVIFLTVHKPCLREMRNFPEIMQIGWRRSLV